MTTILFSVHPHCCTNWCVLGTAISFKLLKETRSKEQNKSFDIDIDIDKTLILISVAQCQFFAREHGPV